MKKLKLSLKNLLNKEDFLTDIFIFGSSLKSKNKPKDIDLIALFRDKDYGRIEDILYKIKKTCEPLNLHIEPIIIDNIHKEPVYKSILHEGFSIRNMQFLHDMLNFKALLLITYNLRDKKASDKVRFSYALYGRKKGEGILKSLNGKENGKGSILVPIGKQEIIKDFFAGWNVKFKEQRISIFE